MEVYNAIAAITAEMSKVGISKDQSNQQQGYKYRGIDDVYNALAPKLAAHKLCILPRVMTRDTVERHTAKGNALFYTTLLVEFDFVSAVDGSKHTVCTVGEAMDSADKSSNKAMSAAYKYAAFQAFCVPTEGDNDADATTHEVRATTADKPKSEFRPTPPAQPGEVKCPKCGKGMWDNRASKKSPNMPDYKCKDKANCDGVIWPPKPQKEPVPPRQPGEELDFPPFDPDNDVPFSQG